MYTLEVLANRAEIHKKWNHTYIQQGLLPPPLVMDNGDFYSDAHLERLLLLRELAEKGISVSRMSAYLNGERKCLRHSMEEREMSTGCGGENFSVARVNCMELAPGIYLSYPQGTLSGELCKKLADYLNDCLKKEMLGMN